MTHSHCLDITSELARKLIIQQFPEYAALPMCAVECQGHDNRTYRLGEGLLMRMPTEPSYALKVPIEQELLPKLAKGLSLPIPVPVKVGKASADYPYPFSIYKWLPGKSLNLLSLRDSEKEQLAFDLAQFLKELQAITDLQGLAPGQHNWWRGDHVSVYDKGAREQIGALDALIDTARALTLWEKACATQWDKEPVWVHGDVAIGNILIEEGKLSAVIDFGGVAVGDPACDLVIAWTYLAGKAREIFIREMALDDNTWLRARAWALWKATFELSQITDKTSAEALAQRMIIEALLSES
jgi:aminoglycoside phosphotransferase (APT) family kinase protein